MLLSKCGSRTGALMAAAIGSFGFSADAQNFVGGGDLPTFTTNPAVTITDHSGEAGGRVVADIVNGAGMVTKTTDSNLSPFGRMGLFRGHNHANPGTVPGSNWARIEFDQAYELSNIWIWNWNEDNNEAGDNTRFGWKHITVQYSLTGGPNPSDWTTADLLLGAAGDNLVPESLGLNTLTPGEPDLVAPFSFSGSVMAKYVVLTNTGAGAAIPGTVDPLAEITWGGDDGAGDAGLSEVRFEIAPIPEPASLGLLAMGGVAVLRRRK